MSKFAESTGVQTYELLTQIFDTQTRADLTSASKEYVLELIFFRFFGKYGQNLAINIIYL